MKLYKLCGVMLCAYYVQTCRYDRRGRGFGALTLTTTRAIGEGKGDPVVRDQDLTALTLSKKRGPGGGGVLTSLEDFLPPCPCAHYTTCWCVDVQ